MNGFTHLRDIRFSDAKANLLLRGGIINRENLMNASNSIITMTDVHFGVAKRINNITSLEVMVEDWHHVMCGDTDTLYNLYTKCEDKHCNHEEDCATVEMSAETEFVQEKIDNSLFNCDEPEIDESIEEAEETVEEMNDIEDHAVKTEIPGQEVLEEVASENETVDKDDVTESNEEIEEEPAEEVEESADQDAASDVFVTGMTVEGEHDTDEKIESSMNVSASTNANNNNNQGNVRRQVNINNNHGAKRRHR